MMGMDPKMMEGLLKAQGIESKALDVKKAILELDGKRMEIISPVITVMRLGGAISYNISAAEANIKEDKPCKKQKE